jgi:type VI protein secretion system component VasF
MSSWAPVEAETARTVARIFATEFVDEAEVLSQTNDGSPRARRHLEAALAYHPASNEVRTIHAVYIEAWQTLLKAFEQIEQGLRQGDQQALAQGRRGLVAWRDQVMDVAFRLRALSDRLSLPTGSETKVAEP